MKQKFSKMIGANLPAIFRTTDRGCVQDQPQYHAPSEAVSRYQIAQHFYVAATGLRHSRALFKATTLMFTRILILLCIAVSPLFAQPQPNLQKAPSPLPKDFPQLSSLLEKDGKPITTRRDWEKERARFQKEWHSFLGEMPKKRATLKTDFGKTESLDGFTRQYVRYQIEEGHYTDGYLLKPVPTPSKSPAIVVFHGTTPLQAKGVAGLASDYSEEKWMGPQLVKRGYVVWCPRNYIFEEGTRSTNGIKLYTENAERVIQQHRTWTGMTRMTFDAIRAADFIESLPNVDKDRIGCIGHSLGAKVTLYAAAFDSRYKAAVFSEGGIGLKFSNWEAVWYLGEKIKEPGFPLENHQLLAMVAPRPFLLLAGESADNDKSWAFLESVRPVYKLYGKEENIGWFNHRQGHRYSPEARAVAEGFLDQYLKR